MGGSIRRFSAASRSSPVTRPLTSLLVGEQLSPNTRLEGTVVQVIPYDVSARTSALAIVQDNRRVKIVLRGSWSMAAPDYFRTKLNRPVRIIADGGETVTVVSQQRDRNGDVVWGGNQLGISFENGFRGYWRNEITRAKEPFAFKKTDAQARPYVELSSPTNGAGQFPRRSLDPARIVTPALTERTNQSAQATTTGMESKALETYRKLGVPTPAPAVDPLVAMVQMPSPPSEASLREALSARRGPEKRHPESPTEMTRTAKQEAAPVQKRQRREERTTWGLQASTHTYPSLTDLTTMKSGNGIKIIAVAQVRFPPAPPEGNRKDWGTHIVLYDPTRPVNGITLRTYGVLERDLPHPNDGDIVIVRNLNWTKDRTWLTGYSGKPEYLVLTVEELLSGLTLDQVKLPPTRGANISQAELDYARDIARWSRKNGLLDHLVREKDGQGADTAGTRDVKAESAALARGRGGRPTLLVEEIVPDQFCDLYAEIVRFHNPHTARQIAPNDFCNLYVTDWTENPQIYAYGEDSMHGMAGQHVFQVSVFGAQCDPLLGVPPEKLAGRIVHLRNIRPKLGGRDFLEATMVEDRLYNTKRDVTLLGAKTANSAFQQWLAGHQARRKDFLQRVAGETPIGQSLQAAGASAAQAGGAVAETKPDPLSTISDVTGLHDVQSVASSITLNSLGTYRFRVRVVDYYPPRLEEWVVATCPACGDRLSDSEVSCMTHQKVQYDWIFALAICDERESNGQLQVIVNEPSEGASTQKILPSMAPSEMAQVRSGDSVAFRRLTEDILHGILGSIPEAKRRKKPLTYGTAGPAWDAILEAYRADEADAQVEWRFEADKVAFR